MATVQSVEHPLLRLQSQATSLAASAVKPDGDDKPQRIQSPVCEIYFHCSVSDNCACDSWVGCCYVRIIIYVRYIDYINVLVDLTVGTLSANLLLPSYIHNTSLLDMCRLVCHTHYNNIANFLMCLTCYYFS